MSREKKKHGSKWKQAQAFDDDDQILFSLAAGMYLDEEGLS